MSAHECHDIVDILNDTGLQATNVQLECENGCVQCSNAHHVMHMVVPHWHYSAISMLKLLELLLDDLHVLVRR